MSAMPQQPSMAPDAVRALDDPRPKFGPNLASDPDLCKLVLDFCQREYVYPQVIQQQSLWRTWGRIDDAFRVKGRASDLDISVTDQQYRNTNPDGKGKGGLVDHNDGKARICPATLHKQLVTKTDMHMSIAWSDGLPVKATVPGNVYEHPLYNPTQQSVDAANRLLEECAREIKLKQKDRKGRGSFAAYGHAVAAVNFEFEMEDLPFSMAVPQDPQEAQAFGQAMVGRYGPPQSVEPGPFGMVATWVHRTVKKMCTDFIPIRKDDFFVDQTMPADEMEEQLCPFIRRRCTRSALFGNDYDPDLNPFGYLNTQQALNDNAPQWTFSMSNQVFQDELQKKWGLSMTGMFRPKNAIKQKWMLYPMLAIYQDPKTGKASIDDGSGITCPVCDGKGKVPQQVQGADDYGNAIQYDHPTETATCPQCNGLLKVFIKPERFVVEAFGNLDISGASATCLRIQRNPTVKDRVPLLFAANLTEDTAGAIPLGKAEASLKAVDQEGTALNQWFDAKNYLINPSWLLPEDADDKLDYNKPQENIRCVGDPRAYTVNRMAVDPTSNLLPFMGECKDEVMDINGMSPSLLGEVSSGRRPATEIQNAFDAGKMPITIEIDQYGEAMLAGWAQFHLDNIEAFADRNWIREQTGREVFGKVMLVTSVGEQFLQRQTAIGSIQYLGQWLSPNPQANIRPLVAAYAQLTKLTNLIDPYEVLPDGGQKKASQDGLRIITTILGQGQFLPANQSDPHPIYIEMFEQALQDPYWQEKTPENLPLLQQRLMMQLQLQQQQMQAQLMAQQHQLMMAHAGASLGQHFKPQGPQQQGNGNQPPNSNSPAATSGGQNQQTFGGMQQ